jgi:hypothetical protein
LWKRQGRYPKSNSPKILNGHIRNSTRKYRHQLLGLISRTKRWFGIYCIIWSDKQTTASFSPTLKFVMPTKIESSRHQMQSKKNTLTFADS